METYGLWLTLPLGIILFLRLRRAGQIKRIPEPGRQGKKKKDKASGFYRIEEILSEKGRPRLPHETYASWLNRISRHLDDGALTEEFFQVLAQHNQWRFGRPEQREGLKRKLEANLTVLSEKLLALT